MTFNELVKPATVKKTNRRDREANKQKEQDRKDQRKKEWTDVVSWCKRLRSYEKASEALQSCNKQAEDKGDDTAECKQSVSFGKDDQKETKEVTADEMQDEIDSLKCELQATLNAAKEAAGNAQKAGDKKKSDMEIKAVHVLEDMIDGCHLTWTQKR